MSEEVARIDPICGARTTKGTPCRYKAGHRTDHVGEGRCWRHGGASPIKHGRYSKIKSRRIGAKFEEYLADPDPLNMLPELAASRSLLEDYIEKAGEGIDHVAATGLVEQVTKIVKRIEDIESANAISRSEFFRLMRQMGAEVSRALIVHIDDAEKVLAMKLEIAASWESLRI